MNIFKKFITQCHQPQRWKNNLINYAFWRNFPYTLSPFRKDMFLICNAKYGFDWTIAYFQHFHYILWC